MKILYIFIYFYLIVSSQAQESSSETSPLVDSLEASVKRNLITMAIEMPFEVVLTRMQAFNTPLKEEMKKIYFSDGIKGFYKGFVPMTGIIVLKNAYIWPILGNMPRLYQGILPKAWDNDWRSVAKKILTAGTMAFVEASVITPVERIKNLLITRRESQSVFQYIRSQRTGVFTELMRGFNPTFYGSLSTWTPYFIADHYLRLSAKGWNKEVPLSLAQLIWVSSVLGSMDALLWLPFQAAKVQMQKENRIITQSGSTYSMLKYIYKTSGLRGVYRGWQLELTRSIFMTIFHTYLFDQLESKPGNQNH